MSREAPEDEGRLPRVAFVGRPNVGKSSLFNRIIGRRRAIVDDTPGVTRDWLEAPADWDGRAFVAIDTGGINENSASEFDEGVRRQTLRAADEADVLVIVLDGRSGVVPADAAVVRELLRFGKPLVAAVNKVDGPEMEYAVHEFHKLGMTAVVGVSAAHGRGIGDLLDAICERFDERKREPETVALRLALLGRPNVGKSSILNRLLGDERAIVSPQAGTTRESIDTLLETPEGLVQLVDTAGLRRKSRIDEDLERASASRSLEAMRRCHVALLVCDAVDGVGDQEARLARIAFEKGRAVVLIANKWDQLRGGGHTPARWLREVRERYHHFHHVPVVAVSALRGTRLDKILPMARRVFVNFEREISTRWINDFVEAIFEQQPPPVIRGKRAKLYYATSTGVRPPEITFFSNDPTRVPEGYRRFLENRIREEIQLEGTPLRFRFRGRQPRSTPRE